MRPQNVLIDSPEPGVDLADFPGGFDAVSEQCTLRDTEHWRVHWRRLRGGLSEGIVVVEICNGPMTVSVLPTRGMGLWKIDAGPIRVGWDAPYPHPVHPGHVDLGSRNGLGWLDGFSELLCRCGLASNGPPGTDPGARSPIESQLTLHGKIANTPAHTVVAGYDPDNGMLWVQGIVDECTLFGPQLRLTSTITVEAGSYRLNVIDEITNLSSHACECQLLYHLNIGPPFLEEDSQIHCAHRTVCPRDPRAVEGMDSRETFLAPTPGYAEQVYFLDPIADSRGQSHALLSNADASLGLQVSFDPRQLPCLSVWKCTQPRSDGYVAGIEPGTNYPNFKAFEREHGRVLRLPAGDTYQTRLDVAVLGSATEVKAAEEHISQLQAGVVPEVLQTPQPPFAPAGSRGD